MMVFDYLEGGNLRNFLNNNFNNINWKVKLHHFDFRRTYEVDIIHHDFHPGNILLRNFKDSDDLCISDFGLSKLIGKNLQKRNVFGVLYYIAPEVLVIMRCWDARITCRPTFTELHREVAKYYYGYRENLCKNNNEITIQIKEAEEFSKNQTTSTDTKL
ncbi:hypothetical protein Glove_139g259 [Diversispora epigaea]|uniref:Protein kinase domain-containing protein n=1 Tax=Diversispora epigaea TaxID=1348612 RepID=A0A397J1T6_9GLOM|nr:hypothetical protein Glove_139g259 [Diversispora epigaea]